MQLADAAAIATVVALLILAYVHAKPAINRWATVKFLRIYSEIQGDDLLTREQARALPWPRRLRRSRRNRVFRLTHHLMTRAHRIAQHELLEQLRVAYDRSEFSPVPPNCDPLAVEAAAIAKHDWNKRQARRQARIHRNVVCAGGCGTRYGKRRKDHNFTGGSGLEGGWLCPTNISCLREPTGEHHCGMCDREARLSILGHYPDEATRWTVSPAEAESVITSSRNQTATLDYQTSEHQVQRLAPRPAVERSAGAATVRGDATPVPIDERSTP
ncbi:MAG: hypothetical protein F4059_09405 [Gemmatimonadetes bacterium]|nr:hypothetical protein [Gemmatimonadota bacterium]